MDQKNWIRFVLLNPEIEVLELVLFIHFSVSCNFRFTDLFSRCSSWIQSPNHKCSNCPSFCGLLHCFSVLISFVAGELQVQTEFEGFVFEFGGKHIVLISFVSVRWDSGSSGEGYFSLFR